MPPPRERSPLPLTHLAPSTLAADAYDAIKASILSGDLQQGGQLSELDLAEALGISRTPVREALTLLRRDGLVVTSGNATIVRPMNISEIRELFLIRQALEAVAVTEWIAQGPSTQGLRDLIDQQREALADGDRSVFLRLDGELHVAISVGADLTQVAALLGSVREKMYLAGLGAIREGGRMERVLDEHTSIVDSLANGDATAAVQALTDHLSATSRALERSGAPPVQEGDRRRRHISTHVGPRASRAALIS